MGERGPAPKRDGQRRRANKPADGEAEHAVSDGTCYGPDLIGNHSAVGKRFYGALRVSGQAQFYEPSDWAVAELVVLAIDQYVKKPSAATFQVIEAAWAPLLVTEGDRRRARLELERGEPEEGAGDVSWIDQYRTRESG